MLINNDIFFQNLDINDPLINMLKEDLILFYVFFGMIHVLSFFLCSIFPKENRAWLSI